MHVRGRAMMVKMLMIVCRHGRTAAHPSTCPLLPHCVFVTVWTGTWRLRSSSTPATTSRLIGVPSPRCRTAPARAATHLKQVVPWHPHLRDARGTNAVRAQGQEANVPRNHQKRSGVPCQLPPARKGLVQQAALVSISPRHATPHPCTLTRHAAKLIKADWGQGQVADVTCKRIRISAGLTGRRCCRGTSPWTKTGSRSLTSVMACR